MAKHPAKPEKPEKVFVQVAYKGILDTFRLYDAKDGSKYVLLPNGKRAAVVPRSDGSYLVQE